MLIICCYPKDQLEIQTIKNVVIPIMNQEIKFEILKFLLNFFSCSATFILLYLILMKAKKLSNKPTAAPNNPNTPINHQVKPIIPKPLTPA